MSNHFHLLLEVPDRAELPPLSEEELLDLLPTLYDSVFLAAVRQDLERARHLKRLVQTLKQNQDGRKIEFFNLLPI